MGDSAAVRPSGHQDHVRPHRPDTLDLLMWQTAIVRREHIDDDCAGSERGPLRTFPRHVLHHPGHHHLQPATRTAGRDVNIDTGLRIAAGRDDGIAVQNFSAGEFFNFCNRVEHSAGHIFERRFHRGRGFPAIGLPVFVADFLDQNGFGRGAATVGGDDDVERLGDHRLGRWVRHSH